MTPDYTTASALAAEFTAQQIRDMRKTALKVKMEGGTITRSYEGSSFTINLENCAQIIADCSAALDALAAAGAGDDPELTRCAPSVGVDFGYRQIS